MAIIAIYVDDLVLAGRSVAVMQGIKAVVSKAFRAKDLGSISSSLGIDVSRDRAQRKLWMQQSQQIASVVEKFNLVHAHPSELPARPGARLQKPSLQSIGDEMAELVSKSYRQAVGSLINVMVSTHPDIAYAVQEASRFLNAFGRAHWEVVKAVLKYLNGTSKAALEFSGDRAQLMAYSGSNYAADAEDRKSISGVRDIHWQMCSHVECAKAVHRGDVDSGGGVHRARPLRTRSALSLAATGRTRFSTRLHNHSRGHPGVHGNRTEPSTARADQAHIRDVSLRSSTHKRRRARARVREATRTPPTS
ncbi:hypothetical protein PybrP1_003773 [[Pythium] brassicae (nom. inval.)]|nr:hypothetical protein PybrP1_003773 [[Pythium] brassicae (nom. inval.)]